jgi:hypothetical protein
MNGNAINSIIATFALLVAALWVAFDIFTSGGNAVARSYMYLMGAGGVYGLLNPRRAFYALLFLTAYLDYFKRLMIFDSALSRMDLYFVLGIAPCTLVGIAVSVLYQQFMGRSEPRPGLLQLMFFTITAATALLLLSMTGANKASAASATPSTPPSTSSSSSPSQPSSVPPATSKTSSKSASSSTSQLSSTCSSTSSRAASSTGKWIT